MDLTISALPTSTPYLGRMVTKILKCYARIVSGLCGQPGDRNTVLSVGWSDNSCCDSSGLSYQWCH